MNKSQQIFKHLKEHRLIALLTPESAEQCVAAYEILNPLGIVLEIALRSAHACDGIRAVLEKHPDALVLAGTVMTSKQAEEAIDAGATGIVSADYIPAVVETCVKRDVMCVPGGLSDAGKQLVQKAEAYGCSLDELKEKYPYQWIYKLFPAVAGGQSKVELAAAWRGPYRDLTVVYTGGITIDNLGALNRKDPEGIFCASALTRHIDQPERMKEEAERWTDALRKPAAAKVSVVKAEEPADETTGAVVTFGEIMLRLSPPDRQRFVQAKSFDATFGGAEANVSVSLANYGLRSRYVTALPDNEIGQSVLNALRSFGVDTHSVLRQGNRIGIYFLEYGASQRPSRVIYDRAGSAISEIQPGQFDWEEIFKDSAWFHWSGITPALSDGAAEVVREALTAAKQQGVTVSADLNYRSKLWTPEKARSVMTGLMDGVDVCIANEEDADKVFGIKAGSADFESGELDEESYWGVAKQLMDRFGFDKVAITLRRSLSASDNEWSACLHTGTDFMISKKYTIHIVDRVGSGDAFSAGLIYGLLSGKVDREALEFAAAASCLKQTIHGDFNLTSVQEVERLAAGKTGGRVQR